MAESIKLIPPIKNYNKSLITSKFGVLRDTGRHGGLDIGVASGTEVIAPADGKIINSSTISRTCGGMIIIDHGNGLQTKFCHLKQLLINNNETVKAGDVIGLSGGGDTDPHRGRSDGAHLHYEVSVNETEKDPELYMSDDYTFADIKDTNTNSDNSGINVYNMNDPSKLLPNIYDFKSNIGENEQISESILKEIHSIQNIYKKLNIPMVNEAFSEKSANLSSFGEKIVSSFEDEPSLKFRNSYTHVATGTKFYCRFDECEVNSEKDDNCYEISILHGEPANDYNMRMCATKLKIKNPKTTNGQLIGNIEPEIGGFDVSITKGLSTKISLIGQEKEPSKPYYSFKSNVAKPKTYDLNASDLPTIAPFSSDNTSSYLFNQSDMPKSYEIPKFNFESKNGDNQNVINEINRIKSILT
jgi:hypothetical protein